MGATIHPPAVPSAPVEPVIPAEPALAVNLAANVVDESIHVNVDVIQSTLEPIQLSPRIDSTHSVNIQDPHCNVYVDIQHFIQSNAISPQVFSDIVKLTRWKLASFNATGPLFGMPPDIVGIQDSIERSNTAAYTPLEHLHLGLVEILNKYLNKNLPVRRVFVMGSKRSLHSLRDSRLSDRLQKLYR